ncbi:MAG TPA: nucleotidyltransferase family protein [Gemmata sp.]|nr:nucleotidyltransferase family protein [Gemmata sp.]
MIFAVLPACGHSTRMGCPKLALPLGDRTVIEHVVLALRAGGVDRTLVVVGPHVPELVSLATTAGADVLALPVPTLDMRATVAAGLTYLEELYRPLLTDWWLLAPADHPTLSPTVIHQLRAAANSRTHSIIIPTHQGNRGHPALIAWPHAAAVRTLPPGRGINALLREHDRETLELDMAEPGILSDLDTPEDYVRLVQWISTGSALALTPNAG